MISSLNTSTDNVYNIMAHSSIAMSNVDSNKALTIGGDIQQGIQETQAAAQKGSTEGFKQALYKINLLA